MKIIISKEEVDRKKKLKEKALKGCNKCPGCGANFNSIPEKITWSAGWVLNLKHMAKYYYICNTCGCEWESDAFEE